ncbi:MAG: DPP IV N-terminal domain-containing protein, partial [Flavobacteriales bacterium]
MRTLFTALALFLFTGSLISQNISVEEAVLARQNNLYPSSLSQLQWLADENSYSYVKDDELIIGSYKGKEKTALTLEKLNKFCNLELSKFPRITWKEGRTFSFKNSGNQIVVSIKAGKTSSTILPEDAENSDVHSNGSIAFTRSNNLFLVSDGKETQITNNSPEVVSGQAFARYEFGIAKGIFWNNEGTALAFYQKDESMVPDYPLVDYSSTPAKLNSIKYPMSGGPSEKAKTGIYHLKDQTIVFLKTGSRLKEDQFYITNLEWSPDGKSVLVAIVNRDQNEMQLHRYDAKTGELLKVLFVEKDNRYVEPEHPALFLPNNSNQFFWISEKDGFNNLYKYDLNGKLIDQTQLRFPITSFIGFNPEGNKAFVMGTGENATESHLFAVNVEDMKVSKITKSSGSHRVKMSHDGSYFIDQWSSLSVPGKTELLTSTGKMAGVLHTSENPLEGKQTGDVTLLEIDAKDGTKLHARMITPPNFDKNKRYPVLVYVYNGPHVQLVRNRWNGGAPLWMNSLAGDGYIVFSVDGRGSD